MLCRKKIGIIYPREPISTEWRWRNCRIMRQLANDRKVIQIRVIRPLSYSECMVFFYLLSCFEPIQSFCASNCTSSLITRNIDIKCREVMEFSGISLGLFPESASSILRLKIKYTKFPIRRPSSTCITDWLGFYAFWFVFLHFVASAKYTRVETGTQPFLFWRAYKIF